MRRLTQRLFAVLLLAAGPILTAQQARWVVTVDPVMGVDGTRELAEEIAATYGGRVERSTGAGDEFVLQLPESRERQLAVDPRVEAIKPLSSAKSTPATHLVPTVDWESGISYDYDDSGNVRQIGSDTFAYDHVGRLVQATVNGDTRSYTYDAFGNRKDCSHVSANGAVGDCQYYEVSSTSNRIEAASYDGAGNVTELDGQRFAWDAVNMMTRKDGSGSSREFVYTADDERIAIYEVGSTWRWTVRDTSGKVLREFTSRDGASGLGAVAWRWAKDYVWRDGQLLATVQPEGSAATTYHYHLDHLGTPRVITDHDDRVVGVHDYYAFGVETGTSEDEPNPTRLKFTGHERDTDAAGLLLELDYMHARYYSPRMGRFLSVDPHEFWRGDMKSPGDRERILTYLRKPQNWNRYAYVMNNPVNLTDPTGETWRESFALFRDWLTGTGPEQRVFVPPSNQVADLKTAPEVNRAREFFLQKNADNIANSRPLEPVTNFKGKFGLTGLKNAGTNSTQQFVGSYSVDIRPMPNGTVRYTVTNTTSFKSLAYGIAPAWERRTYPTPGGNTSQVYTWTEPTP